MTRFRVFAAPRAFVRVAIAVALLSACASACASAPPVGLPTPSRAPTRAAGPESGPASRAPAAYGSSASPVVRWPIKTAEHIDLWLHAFAMLSTDTSAIPMYHRGYRDSMTVVKNRLSVFSSLDANRGGLAARLASSPGYQRAQFLPLEVSSWDVLRSLVLQFLQLDGEARRARDKETVPRLAQLATLFPAAADREWLRAFIEGVSDEQLRFFSDEHSRVVRSRAAVITVVDSLWQKVYRPKFDRFLSNTNQRTGDIVLSTPIGGEGRTGIGRDRQTVIVVPFPQRVDEASEVLFVVAHEITGTLVTGVVVDNTSPAEQRSGIADRYVSISQVRAGALLLQRIAPELLAPYQRYYLDQAGVPRERTESGAALTAAFAGRFALPAPLVEALQRQMDIVLGGI